MRSGAQERGQILPLLAFCLAVLMGFGGMAVDVGFLEYEQQTQQVATDAAAMGGAEQLAHSSCSSQGRTAAKSVALGDAASNGYVNGSNGVTVTVSSPPGSGPYNANNCAISVLINAPNVQTFFTRLFGYSTGMPETTAAVAASIAMNTATPCIYLLSPTTYQNFRSVDVQAPQCAIYMNGSGNFNSGTVNAAAIGYAAATPNENGATFTEATPQPMLPIADPCSTIPGCAYLAANPPSTSGCTSLSESNWTGTLPSGCYSSLSLTKSTVTMSGLYVLNGNTSFNGSTLTGSNTTLYVTASGTPPNFNSDSVTLSPPSSGNEVGVLYYQVPSNTQAANFNGTSNSYNGLIYAPSATVNYNGTGGGYVVLVFGAINWNGSGAQEFATPPPGQAIVSKAVIVE